VTQRIPQLAILAIQIELFPFRYPINSAAEYFGGIDISMHVVRHQVPLLVLALPCRVVQVIMIL
jgi:hypothetical protein